MEAWLIGMKFVLAGFVAVTFALQGAGGGTPVVLLLLGFVSASILSLLLRPAVLKRVMLALSLSVAVAAFFLVDPDFAVLVPLASAELAVDLGLSLAWCAAPSLLMAGFLPRGNMASYLLAAGLGVISFALMVRSRARLGAVEREVERLRSSNESLHRSAALKEEYEGELSRLAQLEERNRLAQGIHDRVGHAIAGGIIQLEAAAALLETDRPAARAMMGNSVTALREGMESIRGELRGIKPAAEELGIHRIRTMLDHFAAQGGISTRLSHSGELSVISPAQWKVIVDNARECLTNAARHSGARTVRVSVEVMNRIVKVEVRDDGRGIYEVRKGLGLTGIEERTAGLGGKVVVDGARGFSVITLLPIATGAADAH